MSPERIGRFEVERLLGSGTFATVWLARDADLKAPVAIKVLAENWSQSEDARRRFLDEARALRELDSDRIVRVYEVARLDDGRPYMVCEYADRGNLQERMEDRARAGGTYTVAEAVGIAVEIAECLIEAHDRRIVHRDLKPSNIMFRSVPPERQEAMRREGRPVVIERMLLGDFGIARRLEASIGRTMVVGTPHYMAPEQADPETASSADERSDIYAAAVILFEVLAGRVPFPYDSIGRVQRAQLEEEPPPISTLRDDVPAPLARVLRKGLDREPSGRFSTSREWRDALRIAATGGEPPISAGSAATIVEAVGATPAPPSEPPAPVPPAPTGRETITAAARAGGGGTGAGGASGGGGGGGNGGAPPAKQPRPAGGNKRVKQIVAVLLLVAVGTTAGIFFGRSRAEATSISLEEQTVTGPDPFYDPNGAVETPPPGASGSPIPIFPTGSGSPEPSPASTLSALPSALAAVGSTVVGLYGGTGLNTQCDRNKLINFLSTHFDKAKAWAKVMGIEVQTIPDFIRTRLVPVVLKVDARVTNHGFLNGIATARQSILQAGSAILTDLFGQPRVRCKCGNPLLPPKKITKKVRYIGRPWIGFKATLVVAININIPTTPPTTAQPTTQPPRATPPPKTITRATDGATVTASSTYSAQFGAGLANDRDFTSSWFSAGKKAGNTQTLTLGLRVPTTIIRVEFYGNEKHPDYPTGFGFHTWTISLLGQGGQVLYSFKNSAPGTQSQKRGIPPVPGVVAIRFVGANAESPDCGGLAELWGFGYPT